MNEESPLLELVQVCKSYPSPESGALQVLRNITLTVRAGESLAVVGPSGSGKSTLLNIMGALDVPTSGQARFGGTDMARMSDRELAALRNRHIGFVFQLHYLLPQCTVLENVLVPALPNRGVKAARARAERLLERVGLSDRLLHRPAELSGGERQRAALVRSLVNRPRLLLADEPTGSLDYEGSQALAELLVQINREEGTALVTVTHSTELAARMNRSLRLRNGLIEEGTAQQK